MKNLCIILINLGILLFFPEVILADDMSPVLTIFLILPLITVFAPLAKIMIFKIFPGSFPKIPKSGKVVVVALLEVIIMLFTVPFTGAHMLGSDPYSGYTGTLLDKFISSSLIFIAFAWAPNLILLDKTHHRFRKAFLLGLIFPLVYFALIFLLYLLCF